MKKILIIDDDRSVLDVQRIFMILEGHSVFTAQSGEEGLHLFHQVNPDLVLTDIQMPGMDGLEVLQNILARNPSAQVIVLTGMGMKLKNKAVRLGATDFLVKPVGRKYLSRAVRTALGACENKLQAV